MTTTEMEKVREDRTSWMDGEEDYFDQSFFKKKKDLKTEGVKKESEAVVAGGDELKAEALIKATSSTIQTSSFEFTTFGHVLHIRQDARECCGGYVWRAAAVLIRYLENKNVFPEGHFESKRVLEVGAGTGLVGISLVQAGASVILTDQEVALELLRQNVINNTPKGNDSQMVKVEELSWGQDDHSRYEPPFDYILASECVYLESGFEPLIKTLLALSDEKTQTIMAYEKRRKADDRFFKMAKKRFDIIIVPRETINENLPEPNNVVRICILKRKPSKPQQQQQQQQPRRQQQPPPQEQRSSTTSEAPPSTQETIPTENGIL